MRNILVVNDDGIDSEGLAELARLAATLGEVTVAAPSHQHSGKSHGITITNHIDAKRVSFPVPEVKAAYSVDGTPADCTMTAIGGILREKPDLVLSGINKGYNVGTDILYSGTIGAAMEALVHRIPAIAFSIGRDYSDFSLIRRYFHELMEFAFHNPAGPDAIWNFNFPDCIPEAAKGILYDRKPAQVEFFGVDKYDLIGDPDGEFYLQPRARVPEDGPEGTDMKAVIQGYISVGKVTNSVMR